MPEILSAQSGVWGAGSTWQGGVVPTATDDVVIQADHTVTLTGTHDARQVRVLGRLRYDRTATATLRCRFGSLSVEQSGVLDWGTSGDPLNAGVKARLLFELDEATQMVGGGHAEHGGGMTPTLSDVGLWISGNGEWHCHGAQPIDAWTKLAQAAAAGATTIFVDPTYTEGWAAGHRVLITATNLWPSGGSSVLHDQNEIRTIQSYNPTTGELVLTAPLSYTHERITVEWTDAFGDSWVEVLTGEVANLEAVGEVDTVDGTATNAAHIMTIGQAKLYLEDVAIRHMGPAPKQDPMVRYALHIHRQNDGSRGSYLRRIRFEDCKGGGLFSHESWGIHYEDLVAYKVAYNPGNINGQAVQRLGAVFLEDTRPNPWGHGVARAADDCRFDRVLTVLTGMPPQQSSPSGANGLSFAVWMGGGSPNCAFFGSCVVGHQRGQGGFVWPEPDNFGLNVNHTVRSLRCEGHSNPSDAFFLHQNTNGGLRIPFPDNLAWRSTRNFREGAYVAHVAWYLMRSIDGGGRQVSHRVRERNVVNFLIDGQNRSGTVGIGIESYVIDSSVDSFYADGVIRNVPVNVAHDQGGDPGANSWVWFDRVTFANAPIHFGGATGTSAIPPSNVEDAQGIGSHIAFRDQAGLPNVPANFDMTKLTDTRPGGETIAPHVGRVHTTPFRTRTNSPYFPGPWPPQYHPRCKISLSVSDDGLEPEPDSQGRRLVTITVNTRDSTSWGRPDAHAVEIYADLVLLGTFTPNADGVVTTTYNMAQHPHRRAYFWARALYTSGSSNGGANASKVLRVRRPIRASGVGEPPPPPPPGPGAPTLTRLVALSPTSIQAEYTNVTNEEGYELETSPPGASTWTPRAQVGVDTTTLVWTGASPNTTYDVRVVAFGAGVRSPSAPLSVTTPRQIPAAPQNPRAENISDTSAEIRVSDASGAAGDEEDLFHAQYRVAGDPLATIALASVATARTADNTPADTLSVDVTPGTGSARLLVVNVHINDLGTATREVSSVQFGSTPLTRLAVRHGTTDATTNVRGEIWYLVNPSSGTNSVQVVLNGTAIWGFAAKVYTGVHQTTPFGAVVSEQANATSISVTVPSAEGQLLHDCFVSRTADVWTPTHTEDYNHAVNHTTTSSRVRLGGGHTAGALSQTTLTWSKSGSSRHAVLLAVPLLQAGTPWTPLSDVSGVAGVGSTITFPLSGLTAQTGYEFEVWASNTTGQSPRVYGSFTTNPTPPPSPTAPTLGTVTALSPTHLTATFTPGSNVQGHDLETSPPSAGTWSVRATVGATATSVVWTAAAPDTTYDVRVVGFSGTERAASGIGTVTTPRAIPAAPTTPTFSDTTSTETTFSVVDQSGAAGDGETHFEGSYREETDPEAPGEYVPLPNAPAQDGVGSPVSWRVTGLGTLRTYRFRARAVNTTGASAFAEAVVTTQGGGAPDPSPFPLGVVDRSARRGIVSTLGNRLVRRLWGTVDPK